MSDWAVLTLDQPIGGPGRVLPLLRQAPPPRTPLMLGGYQQDRVELLMADTGCRLLGLASGRAIGRDTGTKGAPMLVHDCASTRGSSGAPLLAQGPDGAWGIVGIASNVANGIAMGRAVPAAAVACPDSWSRAGSPTGPRRRTAPGVWRVAKQTGGLRPAIEGDRRPGGR